MRQQARPGSLLVAALEVIGPVQPPDQQPIRCLLSTQTYTGRPFEKCAQENGSGSGGACRADDVGANLSLREFQTTLSLQSSGAGECFRQLISGCLLENSPACTT